MSIFYRNLNHRQKCREQEKYFQTILVIIFWNLTMFQYRSDSVQVKQNVISSIAKVVYDLPHELPKELRLRILGNKEMLGKSQIWVQSPFQKLIFGNSSQKTCKCRYQTFLVMSSFTGFLYFVPNNMLSEIVVPSQTPSRSSHRRCSVKEQFLKSCEISQENICFGVSFKKSWRPDYLQLY